jgi:hypothetical protein
MAHEKRDLVGIVVICSAAVFLTWFVTTKYWKSQLEARQYFFEGALSELAPFEKRYGPSKYSRNVEEWLIREFFGDRRNGVFLDVGASHYRDQSNTYYLERVLGWSGVAVDALEEFGADYQRYRQKTRFVAAFVSDLPGQSVQLFVPDTDQKEVASSDYEFTVRAGTPGRPRQISTTTTLNIVLEQAGLNSIDFLSMDIELSEPKSLAGFDIGKYQPSLVCIEAHPQVRQAILDYFDEHEYRLVGKYLRADTQNLYFTPVRR